MLMQSIHTFAPFIMSGAIFALGSLGIALLPWSDDELRAASKALGQARNALHGQRPAELTTPTDFVGIHRHVERVENRPAAHAA
jgi:hypothetical protein